MSPYVLEPGRRVFFPVLFPPAAPRSRRGYNYPRWFTCLFGRGEAGGWFPKLRLGLLVGVFNPRR